MVDFFRNLSDKEKAALEDRVRADFAGGTGDVARAGDTMTGTLTINAGLAVASTASLSQTQVSGALTAAAGMVAASGASLGTTQVYSTASASNSLIVTSTTLSPSTVAPLIIVASTASEAVFAIQGVFMSTASINLAATATAFVIPVYHQSQGIVGYINVSKGVV